LEGKYFENQDGRKIFYELEMETKYQGIREKRKIFWK
jgi:hypothetical protein